MPFRIDWEGLIVGFESRSQKITHFFDRETGDVEQVLEREAARHAEMSFNPRFIALPRDQGERTVGDLEDSKELRVQIIVESDHFSILRQVFGLS